MSEVPERYLELGLRLGRHVDGLVDAYYGPPEIKERVDAEELREPAELTRDAAALLDELDRLDEHRRSWLQAQLVGAETVARRLAGEEVPYAEEVERCYGVRPERVPEERFEAVHEILDEVLRGDGSLAERFQAWRDTNTLSGDQLARVIDSLGADLRDRTERLVGLPEGESVDFDYVTDEPWAAFNYYQGGLRSRIAVNTDTPLTPTFLIALVSHETYPGHHTEHAWKEQLLFEEGGVLEESIFLVGTPQSLVSEGIASLAPEMALGEEQQQVAAEHVRDTGLPFDPELSRTVQETAQPLAGVGTNVALMLHEDGCSEDEALAYMKRWGLSSERRAQQGLRFMTDPVWRSYSTTYTDGYRICKAFVGGDPARFRRLLTEQLTPAEIQVAASS
jgi:hypothetical protein